MKKFCFMIDYLRGGGSGRVVYTLTTTLLNMGYCVDIILLYGDTYYELPQSKYFTLIELRARSTFEQHRYRFVKRAHHLISIIISLKKVKLLVQRQKYDLIVSNSPLTSLMCMLLNCHNVYHCIHNEVLIGAILYKKGAKNWNLFSRILYRNQDILTVSEGVKKAIKTIKIRYRSIRVIYNPFDFNRIRSMAEKSSVLEDEYIVGIGRLHPQKRFDILIQAYAQANLKQKLLILGDGSEEKMLSNLITTLELDGRVVLKGYCSNPFPYIKNSKALIMSSDYEGLPMAVIEALILNIPVVSTTCSGLNEILTDELSEFLVPVGDINALAEKMKLAIQSPPQIHPKYYEKFDHLKIAQSYLSLILDL